MAANRYELQVLLLVEVLSYVSKESCFALKGGTAINLFYRDLPRLSVDIDLTFLPIMERDQSLAEIDAAFDRLVQRISSALPNTSARRIAGGGGGDTRILVVRRGVEVKIETSPVTRGTVHEPTLKSVVKSVEDKFGFAELPIVAFEDLFGGKIHAALDRQHPRDLFDIKLLYENEGVSDELFRTFLVYAASSGRPLHELLKPTLKPLEDSYRREFEGMTRSPATVTELNEARERLLADLHSRFSEPIQRFLLSLHDGEPDFGSIGLARAANLPAVRWKLLNLRRLASEQPDKHAEQRDALAAVLNSTPPAPSR
ncbi:MAG: nucleotidyl transferase AbiEii/AbiGii toxin family protein [Polyangiales bacterium]